MNRTRRLATIGALATVGLGGGALAVSNAAGDEPATGDAPAAAAQNAPAPPAGGPPGLADLAEDLGVTEDELREAFEDARPEPGERGEAPDGDPMQDMAARLADALGLSEARVAKALEANRPAGPPRGGPGGPCPPGGEGPATPPDGDAPAPPDRDTPSGAATPEAGAAWSGDGSGADVQRA